MTSNNKALQKQAELKLAHVGNDIRDIDLELHKIIEELKDLSTKREDAKWSGDSEQLNKLNYRTWVRRRMRDELRKRRRQIKGEEK